MDGVRFDYAGAIVVICTGVVILGVARRHLGTKEYLVWLGAFFTFAMFAGFVNL